METNIGNDINPYYHTPVIDLLIKRNELEEKMSMTYGLKNADQMVNALYNLKEQLDMEIDRRSYNGELNDATIFIFEDYMRRKNDIETAAMNQEEEVRLQAEYGDISEQQLMIKLDEINHNKVKGLEELAKSIK